MNTIIGQSESFVNVLNIAKKVAQSTANVFICGESGTGKEVIAKYIHEQSARKNGPFVAINCSAIPESLLESELFGHAKGAFTGAIEKRVGIFEEAENGTIFLDEIGDLNFVLQSKLLRVLQERTIRRVGENQSRVINARIISATHKNLQEEVLDDNFREDLFFRLDVIPIRMPPLRERKEDILLLADYFLKEFILANQSKLKEFSFDAKEYLLECPWRGNVRELENAVERAVVLCSGEVIQKEHLMLESGSINQARDLRDTEVDKMFSLGADAKLLTLYDLTQKYIEFALIKNHGAKDKTAKELGIDRKTLYRRLTHLDHGGNLSQSRT